VAVSRVALDTSAYSAFKRGHDGVVAHLRRSQEILVPAIVLGELLGGFEAGRDARRNREELRLFFGSPRVRLVPIIEQTAQRYALIYAALRVAGRPIPTNDLWIAASVMEHGAELVTLDRDFSNVVQIMVALYEP
jgi:predicted nucleic acid-binding protein